MSIQEHWLVWLQSQPIMMGKPSTLKLHGAPKKKRHVRAKAKAEPERYGAIIIVKNDRRWNGQVM